MIRRGLQLYCDEEHGFGDVTFPDDGQFNPFVTARQLRAAAKKAGWSRTRRKDFCETCTDSYKERRDDA